MALSNLTYPPEPETYDRALIEQHYAKFSGWNALENLNKWRIEWQKRIAETFGHWHANPRLCRLHLEVVTAEIAKRDKQLTLNL